MAQDRYHSRWYLPAIREFVASADFREDPAWIGKHLSPRVRPREVLSAITTLLDLGLLPGTRVRALRHAPLGDPAVFELRGYRLCLRRSEAHRVRVDPLDSDGSV